MRFRLAFYVLLGICSGVWGSPEKDELYTRLVHQYLPSIPTLRENSTLTLALGLGLARAEINPLRDVLTANLWLRMMWKDYRLEWNPSEYGGVSMLHIPADHLWIPDITMYHYSIDEPRFGRGHNAVVSADGTVLYAPTMLTKTDCLRSMGVYDCPLVLGSYSYDAKLLEFDYLFGQKSLDVGDFKVTKEGWMVTENEATIDIKYYPCCPDDPQPRIIFNVKFARGKPVS